MTMKWRVKALFVVFQYVALFTWISAGIDLLIRGDFILVMCTQLVYLCTLCVYAYVSLCLCVCTGVLHVCVCTNASWCSINVNFCLNKLFIYLFHFRIPMIKLIFIPVISLSDRFLDRVLVYAGVCLLKYNKTVHLWSGDEMATKYDNI